MKISEFWVTLGDFNIHQFSNFEKGNIKFTAMQCISKASSQDKESKDIHFMPV